MSEEQLKFQNALFSIVGRWALSVIGGLLLSVAAGAVAWTSVQRDIQDIQKYKANIADIADIKADIKLILQRLEGAKKP